MTHRLALATAVLALAGLLPVSGAVAQPKGTSEVLLYSTYFVADGMPFGSIEELRTYLLGATHDFFNLAIRDCAAKDRVKEVERMMQEVISERTARRHQAPFPYAFGFGSPPDCPYHLDSK